MRYRALGCALSALVIIGAALLFGNSPSAPSGQSCAATEALLISLSESDEYVSHRAVPAERMHIANGIARANGAPHEWTEAVLVQSKHGGVMLLGGKGLTCGVLQVPPEAWRSAKAALFGEAA